MSEHPYKSLPAHAFWRGAIAAMAPGDVDPVVSVPFAIGPQDKVATAGSCFAQHIARNLAPAGLCHFVTEPAHPIASADDALRFNYGVFSARYGNIYTARQLRQLIERAYGRFVPRDEVWSGSEGALIDPFRPTIQPGGFASNAEYDADRAKHFVAVRRLFENLDVFVFTLGLTECWRARADGAVFPLCPGVHGGVFEESKYAFHNLTVADTVDDMAAFIAALRAVNPRARVILTVSPVPLAATAAPERHVLVATAYSKSVLRVACEMLAERFSDVAYFPSYEIVTGSFARGAYFADDRRSVRPEAVAHVMRVFFKHFAGRAVGDLPPPTAPLSSQRAELEEAARVNCDEELLAEDA